MMPLDLISQTVTICKWKRLYIIALKYKHWSGLRLRIMPNSFPH